MREEKGDTSLLVNVFRCSLLGIFTTAFSRLLQFRYRVRSASQTIRRFLHWRFHQPLLTVWVLDFVSDHPLLSPMALPSRYSCGCLAFTSNRIPWCRFPLRSRLFNSTASCTSISMRNHLISIFSLKIVINPVLQT